MFLACPKNSGHGSVFERRRVSIALVQSGQPDVVTSFAEEETGASGVNHLRKARRLNLHKSHIPLALSGPTPCTLRVRRCVNLGSVAEKRGGIA
jgi:hypothetical protein